MMTKRETEQSLAGKISERAVALAHSLVAGEQFDRITALKARGSHFTTPEAIRMVYQGGPRRLYVRCLGKELFRLGLEEADGADDRLSRAVGRGVARLGFCLEKLGTERPEVKP